MPYFFTFQVVGWPDVFSIKVYMILFRKSVSLKRLWLTEAVRNDKILEKKNDYCSVISPRPQVLGKFRSLKDYNHMN